MEDSFLNWSLGPAGILAFQMFHFNQQSSRHPVYYLRMARCSTYNIKRSRGMVILIMQSLMRLVVGSIDFILQNISVSGS